MQSHRNVVVLVAIAAVAALAAVLLGSRSVTAPVLQARPARADVPAGPGADAGPVRRALAADAAGARTGMLRTFRFDAESQVELGAQVVTTRLAGAMTVLIVDRRAGEILTEVRFPGLAVRFDGAADRDADAFCAGMARALAEPTAVRLDEQGRTLGYRFAPGVIADHRNWVRTLASAFRFVVDPARGPAWQATEGDATGTVETSYRQVEARPDGFRLIRTRTRYPEIAAQPAGQATATLPADSLWPLDAAIDDRLQLALPEAGTAAQSRLLARLELVAVEQVDDLPAVDWSTPAPASGADERSELADAILAQQWRQRLAGVRVEDVLARMSVALGKRPIAEDDLLEELEVLAKLAELRPEILAELDRLVRDGSSDARLVDLALRAASRAGSPAAQDLLAGCAADLDLPARVRRSSLEAMFALQAPAPATVERVGAVLTASPAIGEVEAAAMLLLGAFADRSAEAPSVLLASEARAAQEGLTPLWLESVGNAGTTAALAAAGRYGQAADESVRATAMTALRKVGSAEAVAMLAAAIANDASPAVRRQAAAALAENPGPVSFDQLARLATDDADEHVRGTALMALHRRARGTPAVRALLERRAALDPSADLRSLCARMLEG